MTVQHMAMVFAADGLTSAEAQLLIAYANHADAHGYCWPGVPRLMDETKLSRTTIKRVNTSLREMGLIKSLHRINPKTGLQITNLTRINVPLLDSMRRPPKNYGDDMVEEITFNADDTFSQENGGVRGGPLRGSDRDPQGSVVDPPGVRGGPPWGSVVDPKSSVEFSFEPSVKDPERFAPGEGASSLIGEQPTLDGLIVDSPNTINGSTIVKAYADAYAAAHAGRKAPRIPQAGAEGKKLLKDGQDGDELIAAAELMGRDGLASLVHALENLRRGGMRPSTAAPRNRAEANNAILTRALDRSRTYQGSRS